MNPMKQQNVTGGWHISCEHMVYCDRSNASQYKPGNDTLLVFLVFNYLWEIVLFGHVSIIFEQMSVFWCPYCPSVLQAFGQAYSIQRKVAADGESREETLILESASKEAVYQQKVLDLQNELRQAKASLTSAQAESDRLSSIVLEMKEVKLNTDILDRVGGYECSSIFKYTLFILESFQTPSLCV